MKNIIIIVIVAALVVGGIYFYKRILVSPIITSDSLDSPREPIENQSPVVEKKNNEGDTVMEAEISFSGAVLAGSKAKLLDFNKSDYDKAITSDKLVVLYFYANWCPICKAEFPLMQEAFNELDTDRVVGFRVNYKDNETDKNEENLARQFGVGYQHTKVFVKDSARILNAPDGWDKNRYISEIYKALGN